MRSKRSLVAAAGLLLLTACPKRSNAIGDDQPIVISGSSVTIIGSNPAGFQDTKGGPPWTYEYSIPPSTARVAQVALKIPGDAANWVEFKAQPNFKMTITHGNQSVTLSTDANGANVKVQPNGPGWTHPMKTLLRHGGARIASIVLENVTAPSGQTICSGSPLTCNVSPSAEQPFIKICVTDPGRPCQQ